MMMSTRCFAAALLTVLFLLTGCQSFGGNEQNPFVTEILRVEVEPNPVAPGDTTVFTCVVEDSLDTSLRFAWFLPGIAIDTTDTNRYYWKASQEPRTYPLKVQVDRPGDASVEPIQKFFEVTVNNP
jgi:hypothetical protein